MAESTTKKRTRHTEEELGEFIREASRRHFEACNVSSGCIDMRITDDFTILPTGQAITQDGSYSCELYEASGGEGELETGWYAYQYVSMDAPKGQENKYLGGKVWAAKPIIAGGRIVTSHDLQIYAAQYDAYQAGDYDLSLELLAMTTAGREEAKAGNAVTLYGSKLDKLASNRDFAYKAFEALEEIPYLPASKGGVYEIIGKGGLRMDITANTAKCSKFIHHKDANKHLANRIESTIAQLMMQPEARDYMVDGHIWITTSRIIKALGSKSLADKSKEYRQTIIDGLQAMSSMQISEYRNDKLLYSGYLLAAEYREKVTDKQGNVIKDVWGFLPGGELMNFFEMTEKGNANTALPRLVRNKEGEYEIVSHSGSLTATESWLVGYLKANLLSELRHKLYPNRGKGKGTETASCNRNLNELFKAHHVPSAGNLNSRTKDRIVCDLETVLKSLALEEAQHDQPMYIEATATKAGRSWDKLVVKASKTKGKGRLPKVELGATRYKAKPKKS